jgi:hypothetical protein
MTPHLLAHLALVDAVDSVVACLHITSTFSIAAGVRGIIASCSQFRVHMSAFADV